MTTTWATWTWPHNADEADFKAEADRLAENARKADAVAKAAAKAIKEQHEALQANIKAARSAAKDNKAVGGEPATKAARKADQATVSEASRKAKDEAGKLGSSTARGWRSVAVHDDKHHQLEQ